MTTHPDFEPAVASDDIILLGTASVDTLGEGPAGESQGDQFIPGLAED